MTNPESANSTPQTAPPGGALEPQNDTAHFVDLQVLTIKQPWADAIVFGSKWCENRIWSTNYRGPLYIHAGAAWDGDEPSPGPGETSAILGWVDLVDVVDLEVTERTDVRRLAQKHGLPTDRKAMWHLNGPYGWIFARRAVLAKPIPCKGQLKIWHHKVPASRLEFSPTVNFDGQAWAPTIEFGGYQADELPEPDGAEPTQVKARRKTVVAGGRQHGEAPRNIDEISRDEVMSAIREVFSTSGALERHDAIKETAAALGYSRTGSRIAQSLDGDLRAAVRRGILENSRQGLELACRSIGDYSRDVLVEQLQAVMGTAWFDREELIEQTARWLGFRRTGRVIRDTLKSVINGAIRRGVLEYDGPRVRRVR